MRILSSFFYIVLGTAFSLFLLVVALKIIRRAGAPGLAGTAAAWTGLSA